MEDIRSIFTEFKEEFPKVYELHASLGKEIHEESGPLDEKTRWLIKVGMTAACDHQRALETHLKRARNAGATDEEIKHSLLLLIPTVGFPVFMKAYSVFHNMK